MRSVRIDRFQIGAGSPTFIIAEAGVNHNGDVGMARQLVDVAVEAGADAVKFQTYDSGRLFTRNAPQADYQLQNTGTAQSQFDMMHPLELSPESHRELMAYCEERGILFLSSPFEEASADFLADLGVAAYKIPSGEINNLPYLAHIARKGKPMIVSTGMSSLGEVDEAVHTIRGAGNQGFVLLHCVSNYPADPADANLRAMQTMASAFNVPVGFSDHTNGTEVAVAAVAMGARVVEKHFTLDRGLPGPDHLASLEPDELKLLVRQIRAAELALGDGFKRCAESEQNTRDVARKSLVATQVLVAGTVLTEELVTAKRPGTGITPNHREWVLGRRLNRDVEEDEPLTLEMFD